MYNCNTQKSTNGMQKNHQLLWHILYKVLCVSTDVNKMSADNLFKICRHDSCKIMSQVLKTDTFVSTKQRGTEKY